MLSIKNANMNRIKVRDRGRLRVLKSVGGCISGSWINKLTSNILLSKYHNNIELQILPICLCIIPTQWTNNKNDWRLLVNLLLFLVEWLSGLHNEQRTLPAPLSAWCPRSNYNQVRYQRLHLRYYVLQVGQRALQWPVSPYRSVLSFSLDFPQRLTDLFPIASSTKTNK